MNEQLQQKLLEYLGVLETAVKQASDVGKEQIPLMAQELLSFYFYKELVLILVWVLAFCVVARYLCITVRSMKEAIHNKNWHDDADPRVFFAAFALCIATFLLFVMTTHLVSLLKVWLAPRLFLLEYLRGMIK